jgi:hypothetical protein
MLYETIVTLGRKDAVAILSAELKMTAMSRGVRRGYHLQRQPPPLSLIVKCNRNPGPKIREAPLDAT